jgi:nitroimidazol reductase NimA-like FMN-containing flavoprotein (pyridoxamine 5'-phosphate oxidase superfamily)
MGADTMIIDRGLEVMSDTQCRALLAMGGVGRIGISLDALPAIFPVNYRLVDGFIVFRTAPGSKLSCAAAGAVVAFEVDDYGTLDGSGWSVLAVGKAAIVTDDAAIAAIEASGLETFTDGDRDAIVRIEPTILSGRRIVHEPEMTR